MSEPTIETVELPAKVIEYGNSFVVAFAYDRVFKFTGGRTFRTREAAEAFIPEDVAFTRKFWSRQLAERSEDTIICNGVQYTMDHDASSSHRGFGGRTFNFTRLADGAMVTCSNVWCQGDIPDAFRPFLPNTHKMI